jgi:hypothetical protein
VAVGEGVRKECCRLTLIGGDKARHERLTRDDPFQLATPGAIWQVDQVVPVQVKQVEEEGCQRRPGRGGAGRGAGGGVLEGTRPAVVVQRDQLAVEDGRGDRQLP